MTTHDFRPGDVVEWKQADWQGGFEPRKGVVHHVDKQGTVHIRDSRVDLRGVDVTLVKRTDTTTEHPSRSRAASSLRAASASLTTAIDHLTRAGEAETIPGQTVIRVRTASEETQACIQHATMALYWMLHERLGS